ncbi:hypothetical protein [Chitinophaga sp. GbtcB8]|uniref:hypothetical protein n=1 Tax=Chitinophaga sp. GbtcB8 TaxID=2824753 RepID=UPI001C2FDA6A|nr:hypothetical protein [Chitinophaga sp. GbtcB8]
MLHAHLKNDLKLPNDLSDLLRAQWVYAVSALDKLIHEFVRIGMIETFNGSRNKTSKFNSFPVSMSTLINIQSSSVPPSHYWFEQEIIQRHKQLSFQDPEKIADALMYNPD